MKLSKSFDGLALEFGRKSGPLRDGDQSSPVHSRGIGKYRKNAWSYEREYQGQISNDRGSPEESR